MSPMRLLSIVSLVTIVLLGAGCTAIPPAPAPAARAELPLVYGVYSTPITEPWAAVIDAALNKAADEGKIRYEHTDNTGYTGAMERVLREVAAKKPALIMGDAFGNEEAARRVAADFRDIRFAMGSGLGPTEPNFSVFDNWIHEPAYLSGLIAGGMTKSSLIGVVAGYPVSEVNRLVNAFIEGVAETNKDAKVQVTYIDSWHDPAAAKAAALAQIDAGADVLYAERLGAIEAAAERGAWAFGSIQDQNEQAKDRVLTSPVWNMTPTVDFLVGQINAGAVSALDLRGYSMWAKGGAQLAPFHGLEKNIPIDILKLVLQREDEITKGLYRVNINESTPAGATIAGQ